MFKHLDFSDGLLVNAPPPKTEEEIVTDGIRSVLTQARGLVASPENWLQERSYEYNRDGTEKFSIEGAINLSFVRYMYPSAGVRDYEGLHTKYRCTHDCLIEEATNKVFYGVVRHHWPRCYQRPCLWNDDHQSRHEVVLLALDYAIAEAPNWFDFYRGN